MKKDAVVRARVPTKIATLISEESKKAGLLHVTDYIRMALFEKLSRDKNQTIESILNGD